MIPCIRVISGGDAVIGDHKRNSIIDQHVGSQENPTRWSASRQLRGALPPMLCGSTGATRHSWGRARVPPAQKGCAPSACTAASRQARSDQPRRSSWSLRLLTRRLTHPTVSCQAAHARSAPLTPGTPASGDSRPLTVLCGQVDVRDDLRLFAHVALSASAHALAATCVSA